MQISALYLFQLILCRGYKNVVDSGGHGGFEWIRVDKFKNSSFGHYSPDL